ncbi:putative aldehyde dehydrogenase [Ilyonectria destructans]|nr:putative aldehyde dehydrogenase [Ilyonectria destructans]
MMVKSSPEDLASRARFPPGGFNVLTTSLANTPSPSEAMCLLTYPESHFHWKHGCWEDYSRTLRKGLEEVRTLELGGNCPFIVKKTRILVVRDVAKEDTTMGLLTTPMGVQKAEMQGAGDGKGTGEYFMAPTILMGMTNGTLMSQEEMFASVRGLFEFETEAEKTGNSSAAECPFRGMKEPGYYKESGKGVTAKEYLVAKTVTITIDDKY